MAFETQVAADGEPSSASRPTLSAAIRPAGLRALLFVAIVVILVQIWQGLNAEVSWLLTVGDRWIDGFAPYRDIHDIHPPMALLAVMPAVLLARIGQVPAEWFVITGAAAFAVATIEWTVRGLVVAGLVDSPARTRLTLGFGLLILAMSTFAEPVHIAVIALTPIWAVMLIRAEGRPVGRSAWIVAGLAGGLAISLEPRVVAAILLPGLVVARAERRFAALMQPEYGVAALVVLANVILTLALFPAYADTMLPLIADLYRPVREPVEVILSAPVVPWMLLALAGLAGMVGREATAPRFTIPLLASLGFALVAIEQAKGLAGSCYAIVAPLTPAFADAGIAVASRRIGQGGVAIRLRIVAGFLAMAVGLGSATLTFVGHERPIASLADLLARIAPHARLLAISPHLSIGHPLTRAVGGTWVGSEPYAWRTLGALYKLGLRPPDPGEEARLTAIIAEERAKTADDIRRGRPDIVIVEHDDLVFPAWFGSDAALRTFLTGYALAETVVAERGPVDLWVRAH